MLGAVGVVGIGVGAAFYLVAASKKSSLDAQKCAPACSPSDVDAVKSDRLLSDVSLVVGGVALATAAVIYLARPSVSRESAGLRSSLGFGASPLPGGGVGMLGGRF